MSNTPGWAVSRLYVGHCDPTFIPKNPILPSGTTILNGPVVVGGQADGTLLLPFQKLGLINIITPAVTTTSSVPIPTGMTPVTTSAIRISALGDGAVPYPGTGIAANALGHVISSKVPIPPTAPVGINLLSADVVTIASPSLAITANEILLGTYTSAGARNKVGAETQTGAKAETGAKADTGARAETGAAAQNATLNVAATITSPTITRIDVALASKKTFDIPHPNKEGWRLRHACVEAPSADVYIRGKLKDAHVIELPDYWKRLINYDSITVSITPIQTQQNIVVEKIEDNKVYLQSISPVHCYYHIFAERADGEKLIPEYQGQTPADYPGNNDECSIAGYHYDIKPN